MNFYLGYSIEQIDMNDRNVELNDEMIEYLYSLEKMISFKSFFTIDLYTDTVLKEKDLIDIISMCRSLMDEHVLNDYYEKEALISTIGELSDLCCEAIKQCKKVIVIGD
ncbi:MAG: hypothetical protein LBM69_09015 [Lachnospiraceae bacterium]|jgi:hypothetical protein|nr:hypothetical protein [Lachnospiraceae bacterium]